MESLNKRILGLIEKYNKKFMTRKVLKTAEEVEANTNDENLPSAVVVGELINNLEQLLNSFVWSKLIDTKVALNQKINLPPEWNELLLGGYLSGGTHKIQAVLCKTGNLTCFAGAGEHAYACQVTTDNCLMITQLTNITNMIIYYR